MSIRLKYTLKQLSYFIATAECGSFAEASKQLFVAQPAISSAITKLEEQFGASLLVRHHAQGVTLTPSGKRLLSEARQLMKLAEDFQSSAGAEGALVEGDLYLGSYVTLAPIFLPSIISGFVKKHPKVNFKLSEGFQDQLVSQLINGDIDMALTYDIDLPDDLEKTVVHEAVPYALLPKRHPLTRFKSVSLKDLSQEPFILLNITPARQYFTGLFADRDLPLNITQRASSLEVLRGMIGWGLGVSVLITKPSSGISYDGLEITTRPLKEKIEPMKICMARLANVMDTQLSKEFIAFYKNRIEEHHK